MGANKYVLQPDNPLYYFDNASYAKKEVDTTQLLLYYNPFLTNRMSSFHPDAVIYANEMNMRHHLDKDLQYHYYLNTLRARKRLASKLKKNEDRAARIKAICEHYNYSYNKACEVVDLFDDDMFDELKNYKNNTRGGFE